MTWDSHTLGTTTRVLATLHLADLFRNPVMKLPTKRDWQKIGAFLRGAWPAPIPPYRQGHTAGEIRAWFEQAGTAPYVVVDTEYYVETPPNPGTMWLIGMVGPGLDGFQIGTRHLSPPMYAAAIEGYTAMIERVPVVFHNSMADVPVIEYRWGIPYEAYRQIEDTMLAHSALWSEYPHDLEFLASVYGVHPKLKHLRDSDPLLYNFGDVLDTMSVWEGLRHEFAADPDSEAVYRTQLLPLVPLILARQSIGIRVNKERVAPAAVELAAQRQDAERLAQAYCGWPINVGSVKQLATVLHVLEGLPVQRSKKTKGKTTLDEDAIAALRQRVGMGQHPLLEARVAYMTAQQTLSHYIEPLYV